MIRRGGAAEGRRAGVAVRSQPVDFGFPQPARDCGFFLFASTRRNPIWSNPKRTPLRSARRPARFTHVYRAARIAGAEGNSPAIIFSRQETRQPSPCKALARLHRFARRCKLGFLFVRKKCLLAFVAPRLRAPRRTAVDGASPRRPRVATTRRETGSASGIARPRGRHAYAGTRRMNALLCGFSGSLFFGPSRVALQ